MELEQKCAEWQTKSFMPKETKEAAVQTDPPRYFMLTDNQIPTRPTNTKEQNDTNRTTFMRKLLSVYGQNNVFAVNNYILVYY